MILSSNELHEKNRKTEIIKNLSKYICLCNQAYVTKTSLFIFVKNLLFIDSGGLQTRVQKNAQLGKEFYVLLLIFAGDYAKDHNDPYIQT